MVAPKYITFIAAVFLALSTAAQDIHFSQYDAAPLVTNPALAGAYEGDWQLTSHYRTQWSAVGRPFETLAMGFDHKIYALPGAFTAGMLVTTDQSGNIQLRVSQILATASYHHQIGKHKLGVGMQAGWAFKSFNNQDITFPDQYNRDIGGYDSGLFSGENQLSDQLNHADFNVGFLYRSVWNGKPVQAGYAIAHVFGPQSSFFDRDVKQAQRHNFQVRTELPINEQFFLRPMLWYSRINKAQEFVPALTGGIRLLENQWNAQNAWIQLGFRDGFSRNSDAVITTFGLDFDQLLVGLSYDVNVSGLTSATNGRGALELSLIYRGKGSQVEKIVIPCDRF